MGWLGEWKWRIRAWRHLPRHFHLRPRTLDRRIVSSVLLDNEYRLPSRFPPGSSVLDVGAHIGSFALSALRRGAARIDCFEPQPDNYRLLEHNMEPYADQVRVHHRAVWRSDQPGQELSLRNPHASRNTGAFQVTAETDANAVPAMPLDEAIRTLAPPDGTIALLKLDCEGAEWPILLTSRELQRVEAICGEYHLGELPDFFQVSGSPSPSEDLLRDFLREQGYEVSLEALPPRPQPCGLFFARRRSPA